MQKRLLAVFLTAGAAFSPAFAQNQTGQDKNDNSKCLAGKRDGNDVFVILKDTKAGIFPVKPGDVYVQTSRDSMIVYTAAGKRMALQDVGTMTPEELAGYREKCGVKVPAAPAKTAEHN